MVTQSAKAAPPAWSETPALNRVHVLFKLKSPMDARIDELIELMTRLNGKVRDEAIGEANKAFEVVEFTCGIPHLMIGPALTECTVG